MRGSVYGYVVAAPTDEPVPGATIVGRFERAQPAPAGPLVRGTEFTTRTDDSGRFALDDLSEGKWILQTRGAGGEALGGATVSVFDNAVSEVTIALKTMPPSHVAAPPRRRLGGGVRGRAVRADSGNPVPGARISIVSGEGTEPDVAPVTDGAGWFLIEDLAAGDWLLRAVGPGGETGNAAVHVFDNAVSDVTVEVGNLPRPPRRGSRPSHRTERPMPGTVRGLVVRADTSAPLADATITVVQGAGPAPDIAPLTNDEGIFALDGLPAGEWVLRATGVAGETGEVSVRVAQGSISDVVIKVGPPNASAL